MEDGRPRPPRFEHWRASKLPSRHFKPPRDGGLVRRGERSSATHGIVIPNEPHLRTEESADKSPKPLQKHGKSGVTTPTTNLLKNGLLQLRVCSIGRDTNVVDPLHQSVTLSYVI